MPNPFSRFASLIAETAVGAEGHTRKKILIRKIFDAQQKWDLAHTVIDFNSDMNWHGSTNLDEAEDPITGSRKLKHEGCKWRGENDEGVEFMCNNAKLQHPWRTYKDEFGAEVPEQISFCHYHAKFCLDPNKSHGDHLVKIKEVISDEERSDELVMPYLIKKSARARTSVQDTSPP